MEQNNLVSAPPMPGLPLPSDKDHGLVPRRVPGTASTPAILGGPPNLWGMWSAFRRRWRLAIGLGLVVGAVAAAVAYYLTSAPTYTAATTLNVSAIRPSIIEKRPDTNEFEMYKRLQISSIKSRRVLNAVLREPKVAELPLVKEQPDAVEWLQKLIVVDFDIGPEIMRISVSGKDEASLLVIVDAARDVYVRDVVNEERNTRLQRLEDLKKKQAEFTDKLALKRKTLKDLADQLGSSSEKVVAVRHEMKLRELADIQTQLVSLQSGMLKLKITNVSKDEIVKAVEKMPISEARVEALIKQDPLVLSCEKEIPEQEVVVSEYRTRVVNYEKNENYQREAKKLAVLKKKLADRRTELIPQATQQVRQEMLIKYQSEQSEGQEKQSELAQMEEQLNKRLEEVAEAIRIYGQRAYNLEELRLEIDRVVALEQRLASEQDSLSLDANAPQRVQTLDQGFVVRRSGQGPQMAGMAGVAGFGAIIVGIALLEFFYRRVGDVTDVSGGLRLPVIGTLPLVRSSGVGSSKDAGTWQRLMIESVDTARTVVLHAVRQKNFRIVMITSANAGEGKTMLSAHLAASMARAGWRILVVDGDLRRPSLHKVFGIENSKGLGDVLRGKANLRDVVLPGPVAGLWLIPGGQADSDSLRTLAQGGMKGLFDSIKPEYDFIIVDSAPVLPVVDSQLMAQAVDGVLLSVLQDVSRLPRVYAAYERLSLYHVDLLGVVVHSSSFGAYDSRYPYLPLPPARGEVKPEPAAAAATVAQPETSAEKAE